MLQGLLAHLELLASKPHLFVGHADLAAVHSYLGGLSAGCSLCGLKVNEETYGKAVASRGWKNLATGLITQMRQKGMDDGAIIQELIAVQAEVFRLAAATQSQDTTQLRVSSPDPSPN